MKLVPLMVESSTKLPVATSLTATSYKDAPGDAFQLRLTVTLPVVGPGLLLLPGIRLVGVVGVADVLFCVTVTLLVI